MKKIPFKSFLMKQLLEHENGLTVYQLLDLARPLYGKEKQCCYREVDELMMGMLSVGFGSVVKLADDCNGELLITYALTDEVKDQVRKVINDMSGNSKTRK